jgi:ABC-type branched-subunit amino acid transport system substrate-binding protein
MPEIQELSNKDFAKSWLSDSSIEKFPLAKAQVKLLINTIENDWSGRQPEFLLKYIQNALLENKTQFVKNETQFDDQDLENIGNEVIQFLRNDESFTAEVNNHFQEFPNIEYSDHPILSHFLPLPQEVTAITQPPSTEQPDEGFKKWYKLIFLVCIVILGLSSVGLWIYFNRLDPIFSLCESDFSSSEVEINCGDKRLSNFSKLSDQDRVTLLDSLQKNFDKKRDPSTLIALNNAKILRDLQSRSLRREDVFSVAVAIPLERASAKGAKEAGKDILSGISKKQDELNNSLGEKKLFIIIADDENKDEVARQIAKELSNKKSKKILGVIGPYSSSNLAYILEIYTDNQVPLISPTVTAAMIDIRNEKPDFFKKQEGKTPFFFRTPEDTDASARISLEYLKEKAYKQLIIFVDGEDLYSLSLLNRLKEQSKNKFSILDFISIRKNKETTLTQNIQDLIGKYGTQKATTAILYLQGAYKDELDAKALKEKLLAVLEKNQGEFLIIGSNPVRQKGLFSALGNDPKILKQLVVMQPWFPLENSKEFDKYRDFWKSEDIINWRYVMGYDATQVLLYAIANRRDKSKYPTQQAIQDVLNSDLIQNKDCANKDKLGITDGILTTNITFNGSDRCPNVNSKSDGYRLIKPVEIQPSQWQWQAVDKDVKQ